MSLPQLHIYAKICKKYAKYASMKFICIICTPHFADDEQRPSRRPAPTEGRTGPRARGPGSEYAGPQSHEPSHRQAVLVNGPGELGELEVSQVTVPVVLASVGVGAPRQR